MKLLIIVQDLRTTGTSEGIVTRSFISKLRTIFPDAILDVIYLKHSGSDDELELLPIHTIDIKNISNKIPFSIKWLNKFYWRFLHISLKEKYIQKQYKKHLKTIDFVGYDHVFIRSSGLEYEAILAAKDLPILKKAIINFHDPYPIFWNLGVNIPLSGLELFKLKTMREVVQQAKLCIAPSSYLSRDMEYLYKSTKTFMTLPHQYSHKVFDFTTVNTIRKKQKKVSISYHGVIQFEQNMDIVLEAYIRILKRRPAYRDLTEIVMRIRGSHTERLIKKYKSEQNIYILETLDFVGSAREQIEEADIMLALEVCSNRSNILIGKAPFLASLKKPVLAISPKESEFRKLIVNQDFIASCTDESEVEKKLESLIENRLESDTPVKPFGNYFEEENFKSMVEEILYQE